MSSYTSNVSQAQKKIAKGIDDGKTTAAAFILEEIKKNLLKQKANDTGALIDSYSVKTIENGFEVGSDVDYSAYVEFGTGIYAEDGSGVKTPWAFKDSRGDWYTTSGMKPRPHIRPAFEDNISQIEKLLAEEIKDIE